MHARRSEKAVSRRLHVEKLSSIDSTSAEVRRRWLASAGREPLVLRADEQVAGQGRHGRSWASPCGGLWFSMAAAIQPPLGRFAAMPLAIGVAVADAIEAVCGLACRVKWPNDVLAADRKLAGILCQAEAGADRAFVVIGVGINGNFPESALPGGLRQPATSLLSQLGKPVDLGALLADLLPRLDQVVAAYDAGRPPPLPELLSSRLAWIGRAVRLSDASLASDARGRLMGVDDDGCVLIEQGGRPIAYRVGDLSLAE